MNVGYVLGVLRNNFSYDDTTYTPLSLDCRTKAFQQLVFFVIWLLLHKSTFLQPTLRDVFAHGTIVKRCICYRNFVCPSICHTDRIQC